MTIDIDELERLEKAATRAPWCPASGPHRLSENGHRRPEKMTCDDGDVVINQRPYTPIFLRHGDRNIFDPRLTSALRNAAPALIKAARERDEAVELVEGHQKYIDILQAAREADAKASEIELTTLRVQLAEALAALRESIDSHYATWMAARSEVEGASVSAKLFEQEPDAARLRGVLVRLEGKR